MSIETGPLVLLINPSRFAATFNQLQTRTLPLSSLHTTEHQPESSAERFKRQLNEPLVGAMCITYSCFVLLWGTEQWLSASSCVVVIQMCKSWKGISEYMALLKRRTPFYCPALKVHQRSRMDCSRQLWSTMVCETLKTHTNTHTKKQCVSIWINSAWLHDPNTTDVIVLYLDCMQRPSTKKSINMKWK